MSQFVLELFQNQMICFSRFNTALTQRFGFCHIFNLHQILTHLWSLIGPRIFLIVLRRCPFLFSRIYKGDMWSFRRSLWNKSVSPDTVRIFSIEVFKLLFPLKFCHYIVLFPNPSFFRFTQPICIFCHFSNTVYPSCVFHPSFMN